MDAWIDPRHGYRRRVVPEDDKYAAAESGLGYIYQSRLALLTLLTSPEGTCLLMEKEDDVVLSDPGGTKALASLKHKAPGDRLTDLSPDFWKSVNIWLLRYEQAGRAQSTLRFLLFTTASVSDTSFLRFLLLEPPDRGGASLTSLARPVMAASIAAVVVDIADRFDRLSEAEREDFLSRIQILARSPRIVDIPAIVRDRHMRSIRREFRAAIFERLEGWWDDLVIRLLSRTRVAPVFGHEVSDRLSGYSEEYRVDNLPITMRGDVPPGGVDAERDSRLFVIQLREIGVGSARIRNAILDYYRAFEQRSAWAREQLLAPGEIEDYEDRLVDEWARYRDVVFERIAPDAAETVLSEAGQALYQWADLQSGNTTALRIRERVSEPYVVRGGFHILANERPSPRVFWHPRFLDRVAALLKVTA